MSKTDLNVPFHTVTIIIHSFEIIVCGLLLVSGFLLSNRHFISQISDVTRLGLFRSLEMNAAVTVPHFNSYADSWTVAVNNIGFFSLSVLITSLQENGKTRHTQISKSAFLFQMLS